jgi:hypothetical protein
MWNKAWEGVGRRKTSQFLREWDGVGVGKKINRMVKMEKRRPVQTGGEGETVNGRYADGPSEAMECDLPARSLVLFSTHRTYVDADPIPTSLTHHCKNILIKYRISCNHGIVIDITPSSAPLCTINTIGLPTVPDSSYVT